jgi:hypothetical protein
LDWRDRRRIAKLDGARGLLQHDAFISTRPFAEIERRQVKHLGKHHGDDHERNARRAQRQRARYQGQ